MKPQRGIYTIIVCLMALSACSPKSTNIPLPTPSAGAETPSPVHTPQPTTAKSPWATPFPTLQFTPTRRITPSPSSTHHPTPYPYPTLIAALPTEDDGDYLSSLPNMKLDELMQSRGLSCPSEYSLLDTESIFIPVDIEWLVFTCKWNQFNPQHSDPNSAGKFGLGFTQITNKQNTKTWNINFSRFQWSQQMGRGLIPYLWSKDGKGVFLVPATMGDIDGSGTDIDNYNTGLYYLDLRQGDLKTNLPGLLLTDPSSDPEIGSFSNHYIFFISPNEKYIAYLLPDIHNILHILNLTTGGDRDVDLRKDFSYVFDFFWNTDSSAIYFSAKPNQVTSTESPQSPTVDYTNSIVSISVPDLKITTVLDADPNGWTTYPYGWNGDDSDFWYNSEYIWLRNIYEGTFLYGQPAVLNIHTGQIYLIPVTDE
jgi:hypothetical protein